MNRWNASAGKEAFVAHQLIDADDTELLPLLMDRLDLLDADVAVRVLASLMIAVDGGCEYVPYGSGEVSLTQGVVTAAGRWIWATQGFPALPVPQGHAAVIRVQAAHRLDQVKAALERSPDFWTHHSTAVSPN